MKKATPKEKATSGHNRSALLLGLRQARQGSGLTQRQLGELAGVGKGTIWELETGRRGAYPRTVRRLAKALETEISNLVEE
jgi:transcriptional regulator with XRE-family HTH domain